MTAKRDLIDTGRESGTGQPPPPTPETPPAPPKPDTPIPQHLPPKNPGQLEDTPPPAEKAGGGPRG